MESLIIIPFGVIIAYNIIYPEGPESHTFFRVITVVYYAANLLLIPVLQMMLSDHDDEQTITCSFLIFVLSVITLLYTAQERKFFGTFSVSAHKAAGTHPFVFYLFLLFSWTMPAMNGISVMWNTQVI